MSVRIVDINGATDGLRWGQGRRAGGPRGVSSFGWSYDMLNDVFRLWSMGSHSGEQAREVRDKKLEATARAMVRRLVGLGE